MLLPFQLDGWKCTHIVYTLESRPLANIQGRAYRWKNERDGKNVYYFKITCIFRVFFLKVSLDANNMSAYVEKTIIIKKKQ